MSDSLSLTGIKPPPVAAHAPPSGHQDDDQIAVNCLEAVLEPSRHSALLVGLS